MRRKNGNVDVRGIHNDIVCAWFILDELWRKELGYELVVTSVRDSIHHGSSRHYIGCAFDVRTWLAADDSTQLHGDRRHAFVRLVRQELEKVHGAEFLVIDEDNHLHIQLERAAI